MRLTFYVLSIIAMIGAGFLSSKLLISKDTFSKQSVSKDTNIESFEESNMARGILSTVETVPGENLEAIKRNDAIIIGNTGPVITVFSDVGCIHCAKFNRMALHLSELGKYQFSIRHYVKYGEPDALLKHRILECGRIFNLSNDLVLLQVYESSVEQVIEIVENEISNKGHTMDDFNSCLVGSSNEGRKVGLALRKDSIDSDILGINRIPTWIVNDKVGIGIFPTDIMDQVFDALNNQN